MSKSDRDLNPESVREFRMAIIVKFDAFRSIRHNSHVPLCTRPPSGVTLVSASYHPAGSDIYSWNFSLELEFRN